MPKKEVTLEVAAFLDSDPARALAGVAPETVRRIAEHVVSSCYDVLGKKPRLLDGDDLRQLLGQVLPGRLGRGDPLAEHVPAVVGAYLSHLIRTQVVPQAFELESAVEPALQAFHEAVRAGRVGHRPAPPPKPLVHRAPKLGRNDPCFCGSGKKFKKCHGRRG